MKININYIARVEGEGAVRFEIRNKKLNDLRLNIWEPPRFFEGILAGRRFDEAPDIVARICGICPVSHMTTAIRAIEKALGVSVTPEIKKIRKAMALSQILSSHVAHIYLLALPDYVGLKSAADLLPAYEKEISRFIRMKEALNSVTSLFGGRALHPVAMVTGGFTKAPSRKMVDVVIKGIRAAMKDAAETLNMVSCLKYPSFWAETEYVAISGDKDYALNEGRIVSSIGIADTEDNYHCYFKEEEVPYSNAKRTMVAGRGSLMVGALSRINLRYDLLRSEAKEAAEGIGFNVPVKNPFLNNTAQAIEIVHGIHELAELLESISLDDILTEVRVNEGIGSAVTEAPRGMLYHQYEIDGRGIITKANIVTPTAHNYMSLEESLRKLIEENIELPKKDLILLCEMLVRAYDPCFSCSVH